MSALAPLVIPQLYRFQCSQRLVLDYYSVAASGLLPDAQPWSLSLTTEAAAPVAVAGKTAKPAARGSKAAVEPPAEKPALTMEGALAPVAAAVAKGAGALAATQALVASITQKQSVERDRLWQAQLSAVAAEKEAREAAAELAAGGKAKGKAKPPAKTTKKKGEAEEAAPEPFPFVPESMLEVLVFEAHKLQKRLRYLHARGVEECTKVAEGADGLWASLSALSAAKAVKEGAAVEALTRCVAGVIEARAPLAHTLAIQVRCRGVIKGVCVCCECLCVPMQP